MLIISPSLHYYKLPFWNMVYRGKEKKDIGHNKIILYVMSYFRGCQMEVKGTVIRRYGYNNEIIYSQTSVNKMNIKLCCRNDYK